jgi:hypothetical protein
MALLASALLCLAAAGPPAPIPPRQSPTQARIFAEHAAEAAAASPLATPAVLAAFADPAFAKVLEACCPDVAQLSPAALLDEFRSQMQITEIVHNFHPTVNTDGSDHRPNSADVTLAALRSADFLYNMWCVFYVPATQSIVGRTAARRAVLTLLVCRGATTRELAPLNLTNITYIEGWIGMSAKMETGLLRYPPFSRPDAPSGKPFPYGGWPASFEEASQRPVYAATNQWMSDAAWPWYGSVGVVLAEQIKNLTTLGPFDVSDHSQRRLEDSKTASFANER